MEFKDNWRPRIDNVDDADASAVNEIAEAVISNEERIKTIEKNTYSKKEANETFANALKGSVTGSAVRIEDASPIEHEMKVKVSGVEDVSAVKVKRYGKNLLPYPYKHTTRTIKGVTFTVNEDGSVLVNGTATAQVLFDLYNNAGAPLISNTEVDLRLSGCPAGGSSSTFYLFAGWVGAKDTGNGVLPIKNKNRTKSIQIVVESGVTMNNALFKPQISVGTSKTDYEPYIEPTEYTPNHDGTVEGVTSLSPTTTLMTDTEGAVIDVEYNRDLNKAFAALEGIVNALIVG